MNGRRFFVVAAEPSGDLLAREVVTEMRRHDPKLEFSCIGGPELAAIGLVSKIDISALSILGLFEGLKAYPKVVKLADAAADAIIAAQPEAVVLVDSWGFMLRVAQRLKKRAPEIKLIKLVGPQVWATRPGRAKTLSQVVDELICIHDMETPFYEPYGLPVTVMGNPALSRTLKGNGERLRKLLGIANDKEILLVLPGSRPSEIARVAPALVEAARIVRNQRPDLDIVFAPAESVRAQFAAMFQGQLNWGHLVPAQASPNDVMAASTLALACSGTVTSELAVQQVPFLVGYRTGWITWFLARYFLFKPKVAPEFVQTKLNAQTVAAAALERLANPAMLEAQIAAQNSSLATMGIGQQPAAEIAATAILSTSSAT
ncbi:MAG: lipid-A-disaccharide synthase [Henriciella sp.]